MSTEVNQSLSNQQIVEILAKDKVVEKICKKITKNKDIDTLHDLCQDIYLQLLESEKTIGLYQRDEIKFWIARVMMNNICSSTSPYYRQYLLPTLKSIDIPIGYEPDTNNPKGNKGDR